MALAPAGEAIIVDREDTPVAPGLVHTSFDRLDARGWVRGDLLVADLDEQGLQTQASSVLPQVLPAFIGVALYRLDINLRSSVILGFVGAGGIGLELQANLRQLSYQRGIALVIVIFVMVVGMELLSSSARRALIGTESVALGAGSQRRHGRPGLGVRAIGWVSAQRTQPTTTVAAFDRRRVTPPWNKERRVRALYTAGFLLALLATPWILRVNPVEIITSLDDIVMTTLEMFPPDFTTARDEMIEGMRETVEIALVATALGALVSIPLALLAARNVAPTTSAYYAARYFLVVVRGIPDLVLAIILVAAIGLGPIGGTLALAFGSIGFLAKLMADSVEEVKPGPREAVTATGATRVQEIASSVLPQAMPSFVSNSLYLLDVNIRSATILGIVGGGGIGFLLFNSLRTYSYQVTGALLIMIFLVVFAIEQLSGWIRSKTV